MAYVTGTANTMAGLLSSIQGACVANGWALVNTVLYKDGCYVDLSISSSIIGVIGGTGIDGGGVLTGKATGTGIGYIGMPIYFDVTAPFSFPCTYDVFINTNPDEVYVHVTFNTNCHQQLGWGKSNMPGLSGTGNWYIGGIKDRGSYGYCGPGYNSQTTPIPVEMGGTGYQNIGLWSCQQCQVSGGVDHGLDGTTSWSAGQAKSGGQGSWCGASTAVSLFYRQPNAWNGESILAPVRVYTARPSGFGSPVLECNGIRYVNIANLNDGQIITIGSDKWMVFPYARRGGSTGPTPGSGSLFVGHAFRYDGP